ncbi:MAG: hypothetical protein MZW92_07325 [Comamonadaceae bacterium]|nr:hypothetical protein [Comamonadaceae bacterium]
MATDLPTLSDRTRRVLATLVREHIETGEPVASQALVRRGGFGLSSATIRNILVQLEELGYLRQPHTSAGRVPTDLGYRSYVDQLLQAPAHLALGGAGGGAGARADRQPARRRRGNGAVHGAAHAGRRPRTPSPSR